MLQKSKIPSHSGWSVKNGEYWEKTKNAFTAAKVTEMLSSRAACVLPYELNSTRE